MAAETKTRGRVWEHEETLLLLEKWGDENIQLQLKSCTRKKPIQLEIAAYLQAAGYEGRDDGSCNKRIHTLLSAYRSYKDECARTGNTTPKKKPASSLHVFLNKSTIFRSSAFGEGYSPRRYGSVGTVLALALRSVFLYFFTEFRADEKIDTSQRTRK